MHLINKVYLKFEEEQDLLTNFIYLTKHIDEDEVVHIHHDPLLAESINNSHTEMVAHAETLDDLISQFPSENHFWLKLVNHKEKSISGKYDNKLSIYADKNNYTDVFIKIMRTILPSVDSDTLFEIYELHKVDKKLNTRKAFHDPRSKMNRSLDKIDNYFLNKQDFTEKFNSINALNLSNVPIYENIGVEFAIVPLLLNFSDTDQKIKDKMQDIYNRELRNSILEFKNELEDGMYNLHKVWPNDISENITYDENLSFLDNKDSLKRLFQIDMNEAKSLNVIEDNVTKQEIKELVDAYSSLDSEVELFSNKSIYKQLDDSISLKECLVNDVKTLRDLVKPPTFCTHLSSKLRVNMVLVGYITSKFISEDYEDLKKMSVQDFQSINPLDLS